MSDRHREDDEERDVDHDRREEGDGRMRTVFPVERRLSYCELSLIISSKPLVSVLSRAPGLLGSQGVDIGVIAEEHVGVKGKIRTSPAA